jgi:hypothetical protein
MFRLLKIERLSLVIVTIARTQLLLLGDSLDFVSLGKL